MVRNREPSHPSSVPGPPLGLRRVSGCLEGLERTIKTSRFLSGLTSIHHSGKRSVPAPYKFSRAAGVLYNDEIYVVGGIFGRENGNRFLKYNLRQDRWDELDDLPFSIHGHGAIVYDDQLLVFGGYTGHSMKRSDRVWVYNFNSGEWTEGTKMPGPRGFASSVQHGDSLYVFGDRGAGHQPFSA